MKNMSNSGGEHVKVNFRCERELKEEFDKICDEKGFVRSAIFRKTMQEVVRRNKKVN